MDEFSLIRNILSPIANNDASLGLSDDAAIIPKNDLEDYVISSDSIAESVHFLPNTPPQLIAKKLLRTNLSDLAAMGANPYGYMLNIALPKNTEDDWVQSFFEGFKEDMEQFGGVLLGGDTITSPDKTICSLTILGTVAKDKAIKRSCAQIDDYIYVSGTLGDAAFGLLSAQHKLDTSYPTLEARYHLPNPRLQLGQALVGIANSCMDVSDGLAGDIKHICNASNVGAEILLEDIPLSNHVTELIKHEKHQYTPITGGDDYELVFTVPKNKTSTIEHIKKTTKLPITHIGTITEARDINWFDKQNIPLTDIPKSYRHF